MCCHSPLVAIIHHNPLAGKVNGVVKPHISQKDLRGLHHYVHSMPLLL
jgi:hypothetical protein